MKALKWIAISLLALAVIVVLVLGWLGFVPWLSNYIGPKPRDLGVELSVEQAYAGAEAHNLPTTVSDLEAILADPESATRFNTVQTGDQVSSLLLVGQEDIPNWPLRLTQVRISGGAAEVSAILRSSKVRPFLEDLGVPSGDVSKVLNRVPVRGDVAVYFAGDCDVENNHVELALSEVQVGRLTVPGGWYQGKEGNGTKYIDSALDANGFQVNSLHLDGDTVSAEGVRPLGSLLPWLHLVRADAVEE